MADHSRSARSPNGNPSSGFEATAALDAAHTNPPEAASELLQQLADGAITRNEYLDARVEEALVPFLTRLDQDQLEFMRDTLREELERDPMLIALVQRATNAHEHP